jgi:hypothetical protein
MRLITLVCLLALPAFATAQADIQKEIVRHGIVLTIELGELYPQKDGKQTLASAIKVLEAKRYELFVAHYLDPEFVDARIIERAKLLEEGIEQEFLERREEQRRNPNSVTNDNRLPIEPKPFQEKIRAEAYKRSFGYVVRDITEHLAENPELLRTFRKMLRVGDFADSGTTATFNHSDFKGQTVFLKKIDNRWFLENKQVPDEPKPIQPEK